MVSTMSLNQFNATYILLDIFNEVEFIQLFTDVGFSNNLYDLTKPLVENGLESPVFFYKFTYESQFNMLKHMITAEFPYGDLEGIFFIEEKVYGLINSNFLFD